MASWTRRYTDDQREALLRAVLTDGMSVAEARRQAAAGDLPGVAAFSIPYSTAAEIVRRERDQYTARSFSDTTDALAALQADALRLAGLAHLATKAIETKAKAGETVDPGAIRRAADAITAAKRAIGPQPKNPAPKPTADDEPKQTNDSVLDSILAKMHGEKLNGHATATRAE